MSNTFLRLKKSTRFLMWKKNIYKAALFSQRRKKESNIIIFDTAQSSLNLGDEIIQMYCRAALTDVLSYDSSCRVPTHTLPSQDQLKKIQMSSVKIVCGTNLISPCFEEFSNWKMPSDLLGYKDIITLGVGWARYSDYISPYSRFVYQRILSHSGVHSVRDRYTERKFHEMGLKNVLFTGCPTTWKLTEDFCASIPVKKSSRVITTLTDYEKDAIRDCTMLEILRDSYEEVYIWIQGVGDLEYLKSIVSVDGIHIVDRRLDAYTNVLKSGDIDYVGTRLHAGIHALNCGVRTLVIAVDNRAVEMGNDLHIPYIHRSEIGNMLRDKINSDYPIRIELPTENIARWKAQFIKEN